MVQAADDQERIATLLAPLIEDKNAWEISFTAEEKNVGLAFENELKTNPEALQNFMA